MFWNNYAESLGYEAGTFQKAVLLGDGWAVRADDDLKKDMIDKNDYVVIFDGIRCVVDADTEVILGRIPFV